MYGLVLGKECDRRAEALVDEWFKKNVHSGQVTLFSLGLLKQEIAKEFRRTAQVLVGIHDVVNIALELKQE